MLVHGNAYSMGALQIHAASGTLYSLFTIFTSLHGPAGACIPVANASPRQIIGNHASFNTKIACWNINTTNTLQCYTLIINTFGGPVLTMVNLHSTQVTAAAIHIHLTSAILV